MELISVIVPIYNVQNYLKRCVDSITNQTYSNLEIILVDDGSTDTSGEICDQYAKQDERIIVIHQENGGLSQARNSGMKIMTGNYVVFIDSDDFVSEDYVEYLSLLINQYDADISVCCHKKFYENRYFDENKGKIDEFKTKVFSGEEAVEDLCYQKHLYNSAWAKMYDTKLFDGISYPVGCLYEDLGTTYKLFLKSKRIVMGYEQKYFYFQRQNSIMHFKFSYRNMDRVILSKQLYDDVKDISDALKKAASSRFFISNIQVLREIPYEAREFIEERKQIEQNIKKYRKLVLKDRNGKKINRLIALSTYFDLKGVQRLGKIYKFFYR